MKLNEITDPVKDFLEKNKVKNYTLNPDGTVDVNGNVLISTDQSKLQVKFRRVTGYFYCKADQLTSLVGAPSYVGGHFSCSHSQLTSLVGAPSYVGGHFSCSHSQLTSLEGAPSYVGDDFYCQKNQLTSLHDVHKHVKEVNGMFYCNNNPIKSSVLGLLLIKGIKGVTLDNKAVQKILTKYLGKGRGGVISAQQELIDAGLEDFAKL